MGERLPQSNSVDSSDLLAHSFISKQEITTTNLLPYITFTESQITRGFRCTLLGKPMCSHQISQINIQFLNITMIHNFRSLREVFRRSRCTAQYFMVRSLSTLNGPLERGINRWFNYSIFNQQPRANKTLNILTKYKSERITRNRIS
jgi:hypothetical protein